MKYKLINYCTFDYIFNWKPLRAYRFFIAKDRRKKVDQNVYSLIYSFKKSLFTAYTKTIQPFGGKILHKKYLNNYHSNVCTNMYQNLIIIGLTKKLEIYRFGRFTINPSKLAYWIQFFTDRIINCKKFC